MKERLMNDLKEAMKSKDKLKLSVIRMIKGAIQLEEINLKRELSEDEIISIMAKQVKTRKEAISEFEKADRTDLIKQNNDEIAIIKEYLPEELSEEEVLDIIEKAFAEVKPESMRDMGKLMSYLNPLLKGRADMGEVSKVIKGKLN